MGNAPGLAGSLIGRPGLAGRVRGEGYFRQLTLAAPLAVFRVAFGVLVVASMVRFWAKGWIEELYLKPTFFFSYYGFELVRPLGLWTYGLFAACGVCGLLVALGLWYRVAAVGLFVSFTYIELMDKSTYLNHYYFVSLMALLLVFLPANVSCSVDAWRDPAKRYGRVPRWTVDAVRLLVGIVYVYAGLAKLNTDWLVEAMPLRIWLPAKNDLPLIGWLFNYPETAYAFSWFGAAYDLTVPFFLLSRRTRPWAYASVVVFHVLTAVLFPIGVFPYVMMVAALVFFPAEVHQRCALRVARLALRVSRFAFRVWRFGLRVWRFALRVSGPGVRSWSAGRLRLSGVSLRGGGGGRALRYGRVGERLLLTGLGLFFLVQLALPFRYLLYPRELFWTEEGYRFSWRVMLMEKMGQVQFKVVDGATGQARLVNNYEHLSVLQEKMMATQPDMMVQFAHYLRDYYAARGMREPRVYADAYVSLNGRLGKAYVDPAVDLAREEDSLRPKPWILPFEDEIGGL